jgi:hypothetical protein
MKTKFFVIGFCSALILVAISSGVYATKQYSKSFSDVKEGDWYYSAVMDLSEEGLINGYADGSFGVGKNISREEVAKLLHLTSLRITKLENELALIKNGEAKAEPEEKELEEELEDELDAEPEDKPEQIVMDIVVDLDAPSTLPVGYEIFEESFNKFKISYPKLYYWNNLIADSKKSEGYLWQVQFSLEDFAEAEEPEIAFMVSIVEKEKIESDREVLIFVKRNDETSFLLEGDIKDLRDLQRIAASFKNI